MDGSSVNREHWDAMAAVHGEGRDRYYDVDALVRGDRGLLEAEAEAVGDVAGLDVLHLQCHLGFDAVTLSRAGARVTGADFSPEALRKARAIAERCGVEIEYVEADSTALPSTMDGAFDVVYATIGIFGWIGDVDAWMASAARVLRPGGRLVVVELHPLLQTVGSVDPLVLDFPYADAGPVRFDEDGSYAAQDAKLGDATVTIQHAHSLGEIVTAALGAGLRVATFREHLETERDPRGGGILTLEDDGVYRLRVAGTALPVLFTLVAAKPAAR